MCNVDIDYISKKLDCIKNVLDDRLNTMVEHNFKLDSNDVKDMIETVEIDIDKIKRHIGSRK